MQKMYMKECENRRTEKGDSGKRGTMDRKKEGVKEGRKVGVGGV